MLNIENLSVKIGTFSLENISFSVKKGEYFMLLGSSGVGKSVLLEAIAGLIAHKSGKIILNGNNITRCPIQKRNIGLVFQDFALFPHYSVFDNIAFSLKRAKLPSDEIRERVQKISSEMSIQHLLKRNPDTLSGGEKQRVALARTLISKPDILLLDEPLSALDAGLKTELKALLRTLSKSGQTIIHVTHDYEEAISLAHRVAVMDNRAIVQSGTPEEVFGNPKNRFVAQFSGVKNFYKVNLNQPDANEITIADLGNGVRFQLLTRHRVKTGHVLIGQKNILLAHSSEGFSSINHFKGKIESISPARMGFEVVVNAGVLFHVLVTRNTLKMLKMEEGGEIWLGFNPSSVKFIPN